MRAPTITATMKGHGGGRESPVLVVNPLHERYGAKANGIHDDTAALNLALNDAIELKRALYLPRGVYLLTDELQIHNTATLTINGLTIFGDGYYSVLYQTKSGKKVLDLQCYIPGPVTIQGITMRDFTILGVTGTDDGLYLKGVSRSHFENLIICTGGKGLHLHGAEINTFNDIKISKNLLNEAPILGTTPGTPTYGLFGERIQDPVWDFTTNFFGNLICEGVSIHGIRITGGFNNWIYATVEGCGGKGLYTGDSHDFYYLYMEDNTELDVHFDIANWNVIGKLTATDTGTIQFNNSAKNTIMNVRCTSADIQSTCYENVFINCHSNAGWTADWLNDEYLQHAVNGARAAMISYVRASRETTDQSIASGGFVDVVFNTKQADVMTEFDTTTGIFMAKHDGVYEIKANVTFEALNDQVEHGIQILKNATIVKVEIRQAAKVGNISIDVNITIDLKKDDTIKIQAIHWHGVNRDILATTGATVLTIHRLLGGI